jgi:hypothetical protein
MRLCRTFYESWRSVYGDLCVVVEEGTGGSFGALNSKFDSRSSIKGFGAI